MISASANASVRNRSPFTATQWQELEHQALIFKYMVSGVPIPPDLIYSVKRSLDSPPFSSRLFSHHPSGWGCFEMGFGRKVDPEPGRCRRTDGKKWRCSKEAYPDSKYCERHMHRGRNRSRKHVEVSSSSSSSSPSLLSSSSSSSSSSLSTSTPSISPSQSQSQQQQQPTTTNLSQTIPSQISSYSHHHQIIASSPLMIDHHNSYSYASYNNNNNPDSSSSRPTDYPNSSPYFCLKPEPYNTSPQSDKDYRYFQGSKESSMDELAFFPEASVNVNARGFGADSSCHPLMGYNRVYNTTQTQYQHHHHHHHQSLSDTSKDPIKQSAEDQQHCFILGTDFKSERSLSSSLKPSPKDHSETQKPLHHFFGEWPPKNTAADSWLDLASNSRLPNDG